MRPLRAKKPKVQIAPEDRFWSHVAQGAQGECWLWLGSCNEKGYGQFRFRTHVPKQAHRVAYELTHGSIPPGLVVDHICHNPGCVNPAHLRAVDGKLNNEYRKGANRNSLSGVRGVHYDSSRKRWVASVTHNRKAYSTRHATKEEAIAAVTARRAELFTNP